MNLNQKICRRCRIKHGDNLGTPMSNSFDKEWSSGGIVWCPFMIYLAMHQGIPARTDVDKQPPEECPYQLEHVVSDA